MLDQVRETFEYEDKNYSISYNFMLMKNSTTKSENYKLGELWAQVQ